VTLVAQGVNVAVASAHATSIEFCRFDRSGRTEIERIALPARTGDVWHGFVADVPKAIATDCGRMAPTTRGKVTGSIPRSFSSIHTCARSTGGSPSIPRWSGAVTTSQRATTRTAPLSCRRAS
jgi:hypothetical protein